MTPTIIHISDLLFTWPAQRAPCLDIGELVVHAGERIFIHGPSGSGKSTLLGLLGGVLAPERGTIHVLGSELNRMRPALRDRFRSDHVGFIFQLFNLVPYFGACIHTPPPPANQIIHVFPAKPLKSEAMDAVWVSGVLETTRSETGMGAAGYRMKADVVAPYRK